MKILNVSFSDYANFSYNNCMALRAAGADCSAIAIRPHSFGYQKQAAKSNYTIMRSVADDFDIIQIFHSSVDCLNAVHGLGKKLYVYHTGTVYRQHSEKYNNIFNDKVEKVFVDSPEFMFTGAKNATYIATAIDTDTIRPVTTNNHPLLFAHYPSRPEVKGTATICELMCEVPGVRFVCDTTILPHEQNLKRISLCDVYVELFSPKQGGRTYGSFGVTAFEAAAMGKPVITNSVHHGVYRAAYGQDFMYIANTREEFIREVKLLMNHPRLDELSKVIRNWIVEKHSYKATGDYILRHL